MNALETILAIVIVLGAAVQIVILTLFYRLVSRFLIRTDKLLDTIEPEIHDAAAAVRSVRIAADVSAKEISQLVATARATTEELSNIVRAESQEISSFINRAVGVAERQLDEADHALTAARARVGDIGDRFDRAVLEPARILLALGVGIRKGFEAMVTRDRSRVERVSGPDTDGRHS